MDNIIGQIEAAYGFTVKSYTTAPRGFWAETFFIYAGDTVYFMKIHRNYPWESTLGASLEIQYRLSERVKFIPKPLKASDGSLLLKLDGGGTASLYDYVDGESYIARDACEIMSLMADVYRQDIGCDSVYAYKLYADKIIAAIRSNNCEVKSEALRRYLERNRDIYVGYWQQYETLYDKVRGADRRLYLTHGDVAKNLMVDKNGEIHIIDWDRIRSGAIELDLHEFVDGGTDIAEIEYTAKNAGLDWKFDKEYHNYFILNALYYNLRNLINTDNGELTADSLTDYQRYVDRVPARLAE